MFTLHKELETELNLDGKIYAVNMSFDNVLKFFKILDNSISFDGDKIVAALYQLLGVRLDLSIDDQHKVLNYIVDNFINEGTEEDIAVDLEGNPMPMKKKEQVYCLKHDAEYIFASFMHAYNIDLFKEQGKLDWRLFKSLLNGLPENTIMSKIIDIRRRPYPKGKHAVEERRRLKEAKRAYALPGAEVE